MLEESSVIQLDFLKGSSSKIKDRNCKAVECIDPEGNVLAKFKSGAAARKVLNVSQEDISLCCRGLKSSINGYNFRFALDDLNCYDDGSENPVQDDVEEVAEVSMPLDKLRENFTTKQRRSNAKAVECLDEFGNIIAKYRSGTEAAQALNVLHGEVSLACRGLKDSIKGYRFRFEGEDWLDSYSKPKKSTNENLDEEEDRLLTRTSKYRGDFFSDKPNKSTFVLPPTNIKVKLTL
jgi:hypothetical protein